eukprot:GSA120T00011600001.1
MGAATGTTSNEKVSTKVYLLQELSVALHNAKRRRRIMLPETRTTSSSPGLENNYGTASSSSPSEV